MAPAAVSWRWREKRSGDPAASVRQAAAARKQGLIGLAVGGTVALLFAFVFDRPKMALIVAAVAFLLAAIAFLFPLTLHKKIAAGLGRFGYWFGTAVTWILMTVLYYLLFLPFGFFLKAGKKLRIVRRPDPAVTSYWTPTEGPAPSLEAYRRQF